MTVSDLIKGLITAGNLTAEVKLSDGKTISRVAKSGDNTVVLVANEEKNPQPELFFGYVED